MTLAGMLETMDVREAISGDTMAKPIAGSIETDATGESPEVASEDSEYMGEEEVNAY
jgi:hypothetical protein